MVRCTLLILTMFMYYIFFPLVYLFYLNRASESVGVYMCAHPSPSMRMQACVHEGWGMRTCDYLLEARVYVRTHVRVLQVDVCMHVSVIVCVFFFTRGGAHTCDHAHTLRLGGWVAKTSRVTATL